MSDFSIEEADQGRQKTILAAIHIVFHFYSHSMVHAHPRKGSAYVFSLLLAHLKIFAIKIHMWIYDNKLILGTGPESELHFTGVNLE